MKTMIKTSTVHIYNIYTCIHTGETFVHINICIRLPMHYFKNLHLLNFKNLLFVHWIIKVKYLYKYLVLCLNHGISCLM